MSGNPDGTGSIAGDAPSASPHSAQASAADAAPPIERFGPTIAAVVTAASSVQATPDSTIDTVVTAEPSAQTTPDSTKASDVPAAQSAQATPVSPAQTPENNLSAEDDEEKKRRAQQSKPFNLEEFLNSKMGKAVVFAAAFMLTGNPLIGVAVAFATPVAYNAVKSSGFIKSTPQEPSSGIPSNSASNAKGASPAISPDAQAVGTRALATSVSAQAPAAPAQAAPAQAAPAAPAQAAPAPAPAAPAAPAPAPATPVQTRAAPAAPAPAPAAPVQTRAAPAAPAPAPAAPVQTRAAPEPGSEREQLELGRERISEMSSEVRKVAQQQQQTHTERKKSFGRSVIEVLVTAVGVVGSIAEAAISFGG